MLGEKEIIVQINVLHSRKLKYINVNNLCTALECDQDLGSLPRDKLTKIFHMLFVVSGCDYISFFKGHGKGAILNTFYQHTAFISGDNAFGLLSNILEGTKEEGFL